MDWLAVASAATGAAVAFGGTVLAHVLRTRSERGRDDRAGRRQSYVDFVLALGDAHSLLRLVADHRSDPAQLRSGTRRALADSRVYEARERFLMTAVPSVVGPGEAAFQRIIALRDAVRAGEQLASAGYHDAYHELSAATWQLRQAVRRDLGAQPITLADVGKLSWDSREHCDVCQSWVEDSSREETSSSPQPAAT